MKNAARLAADFADVLRVHRRALGLSQEALAERAGLHAVYVSMIERRVRKPTVHAAALLAEALGQPLSKLIGEAEKRAKRHRS
jgi:transcriptional regulator with XRE-family HTH domain